MSTATLPARANGLGQFPIDQEAVLKAIGINPRDPNAQALLLTCERYGLDPVMKHMILIQGRPYVTRDGLLHVAHRSGQFDGIEVIDQGENATHYTAKVAVYRKDMGRPFAYIGRYPKSGGNKAYGPEMAVKTAECMALRRAFNVALCAREELWDHESVEPAPEPAQVGRAKVNETFPAKAAQSPVKPEPWASWIAKRLTAVNTEFRNHQKIEGLTKEKTTDLANQYQMAFHIAGRMVEQGVIADEEIRDAMGRKDRSKALEHVSGYYAEYPEWVKACAEAHLSELWDRLCADKGIPNLKESEDTSAQDGVEHASQEMPAGREPGEDG